ncbi:MULTISPECIES: DnaB-like helicase C-terminal domain-containing protein [Streptosporangium]|uniref:Replicative DNA helicase n=1 Tax=Streptosporangium brasiliense TaxID=47480 RepID=A0ABT9RMC8_9ACTN|nr:DnaB-like helicase C-terminal domain-containing protein [Streptosporangium brasiliense]MDP9870447.1 replicative DNA helicase [Streptosporangium brasiliense]
MDTERLLISKVIESADLAPAAEAGITPGWFADPSSARVWSMIVDHKGRYGNVPTLAAVKRDYPTYKLLATPEGLPYLVDQMREHRQLVMLEAAITDAAQSHIRRDTAATTARLAAVLAEIARTTPTAYDIDLSTNGDERLTHYRELDALDGRLRGIPSGFPAIDLALQGFEPGQLITFVGPPKTGKSTSMLLMAKAANDSGKEPLFVGFEMSNREQWERLDAIRAGISHKRLRNGTLKPAEWKLLERSVRASQNLPSFHMSQDTSSVTTLTGLRTKIEKLDPDIVYVDGVYMMQDEEGEPSGSSQALTNITRGMKRLAQQLEKPIVIATQALESKMNGKKLTTYSIGYSSSFVQDSDAVIGVQQTDDPNITLMKLLAGRNASPMEAYYTWTWEPVKFEELEYNPFGGDGYEGGSDGW